MFEAAVLLVIYVADWLLGFTGTGGYLLLLFPMLLFFCNRSTFGLLLGGFVAGLLAEMIHGYMAGSLLLGVGVAIFILQRTKTLIQWQLLIIKFFGLLLFLSVVFLLRAAVVFTFAQVVVLPDFIAFFTTMVLAVLVLLSGSYLQRSPVSRVSS